MIKFILAQGIGFAPGSVQYIPTLGFGIGEAPLGTGPPLFGDTRVQAFEDSAATRSMAFRAGDMLRMQYLEHTDTARQQQFRDE